MSTEQTALPGLTARAHELVVDHRWMVRVVAKRLLVRASSAHGAGLDELVSWGNKGLIEAAVRFDSHEAGSFTRFAWLRVEGAMRDGLRAERRYNRHLVHAAEASAATFVSTLPDADPFQESEALSIAILEEEAFGAVAARALGLAGSMSAVTPEDAMVFRQEHERLLALLEEARAALPERDREILRLHYDHQLPLAEVATRLGFPYSTLTRFHREAVVRCGKHLRTLGLQNNRRRSP